MQASRFCCRLASGRSDGPHGKSRMRSKSEEARSSVDVSTAAAEIARLRQHSARKRASPAANEAIRSAAAQGITTAQLISLAHGSGAAAPASKDSSKAPQREALPVHNAASQSQREALQQAARASAQLPSMLDGPKPQQHSDAAASSAVAKPRRRRQRAQSVGSAAGSSRTMSVPTTTAATELQKMCIIRQSSPAAGAATPAEAVPAEAIAAGVAAAADAPTGAAQQPGSPPMLPQHRCRRSRSTDPLSAATLSAHTLAQASLRTQSASTVSMTSCPKLDELLAVLRVSSTASKQKAAFRSTKTYSEPWLATAATDVKASRANTTAASLPASCTVPEAGSGEPVAQLQTPIRQLRTASAAAVSPFAAPELQAASTKAEMLQPRLSTRLSSTSAADTTDAKAAGSAALTGPPESPHAAARCRKLAEHSSRLADGSTAQTPFEADAAPPPVNEYLAMMGGCHSLQFSEQPGAGRRSMQTYQSPFMQVGLKLSHNTPKAM